MTRRSFLLSGSCLAPGMFVSADTLCLAVRLHDPQPLMLDWPHPDEPVPLGSVVKPFTALAYAAAHEYRYPSYVCDGRRCWRPEGHGPVTIVTAMAHSCNAYFLRLAAETPQAVVAATWERFGLMTPAAMNPDVAIGLGRHAPASPASMLRAYEMLVARREEPGVSELLAGLGRAATEGTGCGVGNRDVLVKTGTVPCLAPRRHVGDGVAVVLAPAGQPRIGIMLLAHGVTGAQAAQHAGQRLPRLLHAA